MDKKQIGAIVNKGPQDWAIVQQRNGTADIVLAGRWHMDEPVREAQAYARVVREDSAETVVGWTKAEMAENRSWSVRLNGVKAGGLYRIETCLQVDGNPAMEWAIRGDMIHHVGVGDLWLIAGQSNAAGYGKGPVNDPPELGVHLLRNSGRWDLASHPFNESTNTLHIENRETANPGHSPFLAFAKLLKRELGYPIGLVQTALGGSPLKAWNPLEDGTLYRNMLSVVRDAGGSAKGVVWYQGCSDCYPGDCETYAARFRQMVEQWRADLGEPALPFVTVQLNRYTKGGGTEEDDRAWGLVREQQRVAARDIPNVTVVPAIDSPLSDEIHNSPAGNLIIGERTARAALASVYGRDVHFRAPEIAGASYVAADAGGPAVELKYDHVGGYLVSIGPNHPVFTVEDEDGRAPIEEWSISGRSGIRIRLARPLRGQAFVHGGFERNPAPYFPLDSLTYMPPLSFYQYPIRSAEH
ncbi:sialate O-acetylesterase [Cohnella hongkongensis]|uniref:Sialate O-acetylesterase n=1 Tax=Cohnella hongkongensis TaxID=178337 RepID=A0ABV9FDX2_9BACL